VTTYGNDRPQRLVLSPGRGSGGVDGAWWPWSQDMDTEVAGLVGDLTDTVAHVVTALHSRPHWPVTPRDVGLGPGCRRTGFFLQDEVDLLLLRLSGGGRLKLLVIPPGTDDVVAGSVLASVGEARWQHPDEG
jgi:hypothetical protein